MYILNIIINHLLNYTSHNIIITSLTTTHHEPTSTTTTKKNAPHTTPKNETVIIKPPQAMRIRLKSDDGLVDDSVNTNNLNFIIACYNYIRVFYLTTSYIMQLKYNLPPVINQLF